MGIALRHAAIFVDLENIYYFLKNRVAEGHDIAALSVDMVRQLRHVLAADQQVQCIVQHAYADFSRLPGEMQGAMYLMGMETHHVLGTDHKNAADMRLCIDAMETLYVRGEIASFILMGGDRDYIPVVQHLRKHGKEVLISAFKAGTSGDLLQVADESNFIDLTPLLPNGIKLVEPLRPVHAPVAVPPMKPQPPIAQVSSTYAEPKANDRTSLPKFAKPRKVKSADELDTLALMLQHFPDKPEIWLTPFLHRQRTNMSHLADYERRALLTNLAEAGAIVIEKRPGDQGEFSVIVLNWNHPDVQELC